MPVHQHQPEIDIDLDELISDLRTTQAVREPASGDLTLADRVGALRYHWRVFAGIWAMSLGVGALVAHFAPPRFASHARFAAEPRPITSAPITDGKSLSALMEPQPHTPEAMAAALQDEALLQLALGRLGATAEPRPKLTVEANIDTNVVDVTATGPSAKLVAKLPNVLFETYLQQRQMREAEQLRQATALLHRERQAATSALKKAEADLLAFKNRTAIQLGDDAWMTRARQLSDQKALSAYDAPTAGKQPEDMIGLGPKSDGTGARAENPAAHDPLDAYSSPKPTIEHLRWELGELAETELKLSRLNRIRHEAAVRRERIDALLKDVQLREELAPGAASIPSRSEQPQDLRRLDQFATLGFMGLMGLLLASAAAAVCAENDDRLHFLRQTWRWAGAPSLAQIPFLPGLRGSALRAVPAPALASYRMLSASLAIAAQERPLQTLLITSAGPREGRTTTAIHLARTLALEDKRVVLVDANFHRPALGERFMISEQPGLAELLVGAARLQDVACPTKIPSLWVVPSGAAPADPAALLSSPAIDAALQELREHAQMVIIDAPPALLTPDVPVLAAKVDGVLVVVEMSRTRRQALLQTRALLENVRARVVGTVTNKVRKQHGSLIQYGRYR